MRIIASGLFYHYFLERGVGGHGVVAFCDDGSARFQIVAGAVFCARRPLLEGCLFPQSQAESPLFQGLYQLVQRIGMAI